MPAHAVRIRLGPVVVAAFLVVGPLLLVAASASANELFLPVAPPDGQTADAASVAATAEYLGATLRRRHARVDPGLLSEARATAARGGTASGLIDLNLFDDAAFQVTDLKTGPTSSGYSLSGQLDGVPFGTVTLVVNGYVIVGSVRAPGATYTIRSIAGGDVEIRQTDEGTLPECAGPRTVPPEAVAPGAVAPGTDLAEASVSIGSASNPSQVDVLVVYTTAAKEEAGGEDAIEATIDLWFTEANGYFTASGVDLRIHLAHVEELDYVETSTSYELTPLRLAEDGIMDRVHAMRDAVGADVVHLVERWGSSGRFRYCGVAYLMEEVDTSFAQYAFGITVVGCGSLTFAHELGHNMGLSHDRYAHDIDLDSGLTNKPTSYAYGYVNQAGFESGSAATKRWRTIMAYSTHCSHAGVSGCSRVARFSNPAQTRSGDPLGVWRNGNARAVTGPADASLTLNGTRATVAAFRSPGAYPAVVSLRRRQPAEKRTNSSTLRWRLAFNRNVKNVTSGDFELAGSGLGATTLSVTPKAGSSRIYDIEVTAGLSGFNGEATLGFAAGQNILDLSNRVLDTAWPAAAERTYTLDHAAPSPAITPSSASSSPFVATIRFAEGVEDFADAGDVTATNGTVAAPSHSDARTYTVQVTPTTTVASTVTLTVPAGAAKDTAGNESVGASQAVTYDPSTSVSLAVGGFFNGSIAENATWTSATPSVTGSPVGTVSWTKEGADAGHFEIGGATGVLTLPGRDFEAPADANGDNRYEVTVRVADANGNSATAQIMVTVTDAVEARELRVSHASSEKVPETWSYSERPSLRPQVICPDVCKVAEGPVGEVSWTKTGADAALFDLDTSSGDLSLVAKDFENPVDSNTDNDYEVTVSATDSDGNSASKDVTVRMTKGPPRWLTISGLSSGIVEERSPWTSGTPAAAGASGSVIWTKEGPDAALFSIEAGTGVLALAAQNYDAPQDADEDGRYDVVVRVTDGEGNSAATSISVTVTNANEPPMPVGSLVGPDLQVGDGTEDVDVSGAFTDPESDTLTYDASSSAPAVAAAALVANVSGSRVRLTPVGPGTATITVTATDIAGSNTPATQMFDVTVKGRRGVTISRDDLTVDEGLTESYTVVLDSEPTGPVTVTPSVPANRDLSVNPTELEFTTGDWRNPKTVFVEAETDTDAAADAPVTIGHQVSGGDYGSVTASSVLVTIVEADTSTLSVEAVEVPEAGGTVVFGVTLSKASNFEVTVDYATSDGSGSTGARAGSDYTAARGTLTFTAGSTASQQIVVDITNDTEDEEEEETFRLTLSNAQHASLAGGGSTLQVTGTIRDDDDPEVEVSFGSANYGVTEGGTVNVVVRLNRDPERDLDIFLDKAHHGGTTDADYSGVPQSVTFGPGVRTQEFLFAATDDTADDDGESVVLSFGFPPSRVSGDGEATLAIQDNDGESTGGPVGPGGGPPPDDEDEGGGGAGGGGPPPPSGPPMADFMPAAECAEDLCRARTGLTVTFEDTSTGRVQSRRWDFGDGTVSRDRRIDHAWSSPGFYEVTLSVSDGTTVSIASRVFLVGASDPAGTCEADAVTLCLQDSRYAVGVDWWTADGGSGSASVVHSGTNDSGLFWFFNRDNWEILIKVLDGCALNGNAWVFGASTTDLGYRIEVTDTVTGVVREYENEPGRAAPAITDATAFQACAR